MLEVQSPILNFFLLVLRIPLDLSLDGGHKDAKFLKTLTKKALNWLQIERIVLLYSTLAGIDHVQEEQGCKKNTLEACGINRLKIVFTLSTDRSSSTLCRCFHSTN